MTPDPHVIADDARRALEEDAAWSDATASLVPAGSARARILCRQQAILCGAPWADEVFRLLDRRIRLRWNCSDGKPVEPDAVVAELDGPARALLAGERTALNFLQLLSGVATRTRAYADALGEADCLLLDTRKTLPGLRHAQKYAVAAGGGAAHRASLAEAVLLKENHFALCAEPAAVIAEARARHPGLAVIAEVADLAQLPAVRDARPDIILLDNMAPAQAAQAAAACPDIPLEASGSIGIDDFSAYAASGVARLSVGALTKHVEAVDFSMLLECA